ncbi:MAG: serpin family protein [Verrucomicrobiae bacterium]|nr:serpin family protein [Verrucomicrobiae bacterium]
MKQLVLAVFLAAVPMYAAEPTTPAADAINALGIELLQTSGPPGANALLSPYSIQSALAMTYAGAEGETRSQMQRALHYPEDDAAVHRSFAALRMALEEVMRESAREVKRMQQYGATNDPIILTGANCLFGQTGYVFREPFLTLVRDDYGAPFEPLDFARNPAGATKHINDWVEDQTRQRIRDLIPEGALNDLTRLVLVNAIYLKAPWAEEFRASATKSQPFHLGANNLVNVPMMTAKRTLGFARRNGHVALNIPYRGGELHFLILLPDRVDGLADLEKALTARSLADCARLNPQEVILHLPKFKLEPPVMALGRELQKLGMKSAFDQPRGSANFDRIAPRRPDDYLYISEVFHKTFLNLDEKGTEAAAATAVAMFAASAVMEKPKPIEVRVDRPFLFAIQHRASGACLFLGHLRDPR